MTNDIDVPAFMQVLNGLLKDLRSKYQVMDDPTLVQKILSHLSNLRRRLAAWIVGIMSLPQESKTFSKTVIDPKWIEAMQEEMASIHKNHTWNLVELPFEKSVV